MMMMMMMTMITMVMMMMDSHGIHILGIHDKGVLTAGIHNKESQFVWIHHEGVLLSGVTNKAVLMMRIHTGIVRDDVDGDDQDGQPKDHYC